MEKNVHINYENNNLEKKSNQKKCLNFYRNKNHYWFEINQALKYKSAGESLRNKIKKLLIFFLNYMVEN